MRFAANLMYSKVVPVDIPGKQYCFEVRSALKYVGSHPRPHSPSQPHPPRIAVFDHGGAAVHHRRSSVLQAPTESSMRMWVQAAKIVGDEMQRWRPERKLHVKVHHKDLTRRLCISRGITYRAFVVRHSAPHSRSREDQSSQPLTQGFGGENHSNSCRTSLTASTPTPCRVRSLSTRLTTGLRSGPAAADHLLFFSLVRRRGP